MKIQWNKVTWYSKMIALVLFVILPFVGFWYGIQYGQMMAEITAVNFGNPQNSSTSTVASGSEYYGNVSEWQTDQDAAGKFSIAYPIDFSIDQNYAETPSTDWSVDNPSDASGVKALTVTIPSAFEPQTNFADATLTVGHSANAAAVADCLALEATGGPAMATTTATINGSVFTVFHSNDAGAGNMYETTSYRTVHTGQCYAVEYTIHSSQIGNYPSSYNLKPFNEAQATGVLDRIVGTFTFL